MAEHVMCGMNAASPKWGADYSALSASGVLRETRQPILP